MTPLLQSKKESFAAVSPHLKFLPFSSSISTLPSQG
jgi:hypothetical protein